MVNERQPGKRDSLRKMVGKLGRLQREADAADLRTVAFFLELARRDAENRLSGQAEKPGG